MIVHAHIHTVEDHCDKLRLKAQGKAIGSGENGPYLPIEIDIPNTTTAQRSYHVGRRIVVTVEPA